MFTLVHYIIVHLYMYICSMWISSMLITRLADLLTTRKVLPAVAVRKLCQTIGEHCSWALSLTVDARCIFVTRPLKFHPTAGWGSAIALIAASYSGCDRMLTVALLTIAVGINGAIYGGYIVNHVDIASNHAGVLMGISNTIANLCGVGAPYVAGLIINNNVSNNVQRAQVVFLRGISYSHIITDLYFSRLWLSGNGSSSLLLEYTLLKP